MNQGFNLRPSDIQAVMGSSQFKRLGQFIKIRTSNRERIISSLKKDPRWNNQFRFIKIPKNIFPSYMGLPILLNKSMNKKVKMELLFYLESKGIETRPILTGNFLNQPSIKLFRINKNKFKFRGAQSVEDLGFLIGLHTKKIKNRHLNLIKNSLFHIDYLMKNV